MRAIILLRTRVSVRQTPLISQRETETDALGVSVGENRVRRDRTKRANIYVCICIYNVCIRKKLTAANGEISRESVESIAESDVRRRLSRKDPVFIPVAVRTADRSGGPAPDVTVRAFRERRWL